MMSDGLASGDRIEIRGFGSFSLHFRPARVGRNPKSGDKLGLRSKFVPHFKPGKELHERVNLNKGENYPLLRQPNSGFCAKFDFG
jgi:integration host factor subunit beta